VGKGEACKTLKDVMVSLTNVKSDLVARAKIVSKI
jgi:hypothetical protein